MHKKVQSLLITGVLSANMFGSTVAVFADDALKVENDTSIEEVVDQNGEKITWQKTTKENYEKLWECSKQGNTIVLKKYKDENKIKNIEIPRKIDGKKVVLDHLNTDTFPNVERIKVQKAEKDEELIQLNETNLQGAFENNKNLKYLDLRGIDVSKVTDLWAFLSENTKLEEVNLSGWDVSKVTDMRSLFYKDTSLKKIDISGWKPSDELENTRYMFNGCSSLESIDLNGFDMRNVTNTNSMFYGCSSLTEIKGSEKWTLEKVTDIGLMFKGTKLSFINLSKVKLPDNETLDDNSMKLIFEDSENKRNLLVVTNDKRLKEYDYTGDNRNRFNLTFKANGGTFDKKSDIKNINDFTITTDEFKLLTSPTRDEYVFKGWDRIDNTLTAKWEQKVAPGESESQGGVVKPGGSETPGESGSQGGVVKPGGSEAPGESGSQGGVVKPGGSEAPGESGNQGGIVKPGGSETPGESGNQGGVVKPGGSETPGESGSQGGVVKPGGSETPGESGNQGGIVKPGGSETPGESGNQGGVVKPGESETPGESGNQGGIVKPGGSETSGESGNQGGVVKPGESDKPGTGDDNTTVVPPQKLPSVYELIDENMVTVTEMGDGTENNPLILQVKDSIYKVDLTHFITKFDTLNSNVSTIKRNDKYTEYNITVDNKNATSSIKKTAPAINDKITFVKLRINNTKIDLIKEANRYSRRRNYEVKIPIIVKFSDVKDNFWGRSCIEDFASMGIVDGYPNNEFKPNNSITRAEFVRIINNAFGYTKAAKNVKFNDVEKNSWYYNDIAIGLEQGYINGRSETTFSPNDNITREEVAMILTNIMKNKDNDFNRLNNFNDGNKTSDWAKSAMAGAIKAGYLIGDDQKNLSPTKNMTRAEAIASLSRVRPAK